MYWLSLAEIEKGLLLEKINELEEELPELERRILLDKYQEGNRHSTHSVEIDELENMFRNGAFSLIVLTRIYILLSQTSSKRFNIPVSLNFAERKMLFKLLVNLCLSFI